MATPAENPFSGLTQQVLGAAAAIKGLNAVLTSVTTGIQSFRNIMRTTTAEMGAFGAFTRGFFGALAAMTQSVIKAALGLAAMGAAALGPAGFNVLGQVMQYLISVIGSVGVPIFGLLAAVALALADTFRDKLLAASLALAEFLAENLVPAVTRVADLMDVLSVGMSAVATSFRLTQAALANFVEWLLGFVVPGGISFKQSVMQFQKEAMQAVIDHIARVAEADRRLRDREQQRIVNRQGGAPGGLGGAVVGGLADNLRDVIMALRQSLGSQGQVGFAGVGDVAKQVQMQAFQNNIQRKTLDMIIKNIGVLEKLEKWLRQFGAPVAAVGA